MSKEMALMVGLPASGKSTFIDSIDMISIYQIICADDTRKALGVQFDPKLESIVHTVNEYAARSSMERGMSVLIDNTNVSSGIIKKWTRMADEYGYKKVAYIMHTSLKECIERDSRRVEKVGIEVMEKMADQLKITFDDMTLDEVMDEIYYILPDGNTVKLVEGGTQWMTKSLMN